MYLTRNSRLSFAGKLANCICSTTYSDANFQSKNESVCLKHLKKNFSQFE